MKEVFLVGLGFTLSIPLWAAVEYVYHRWVMHWKEFSRVLPIAYRSFEAHTKLHHSHYFKVFDNEPDPAAKYISHGVDPVWNVIGMSVVWLPIGFLVSWYLALGITLKSFLHGFLWTQVHHEFHWPKYPWWTNTGWYRYLRRNHELHHEHPNKNFAVLLPPVMDLLFGTHING